METLTGQGSGPIPVSLSCQMLGQRPEANSSYLGRASTVPQSGGCQETDSATALTMQQWVAVGTGVLSHLPRAASVPLPSLAVPRDSQACMGLLYQAQETPGPTVTPAECSSGPAGCSMGLFRGAWEPDGALHGPGGIWKGSREGERALQSSWQIGDPLSPWEMGRGALGPRRLPCALHSSGRDLGQLEMRQSQPLITVLSALVCSAPPGGPHRFALSQRSDHRLTVSTSCGWSGAEGTSHLLFPQGHMRCLRRRGCRTRRPRGWEGQWPWPMTLTLCIGLLAGGLGGPASWALRWWWMSALICPPGDVVPDGSPSILVMKIKALELQSMAARRLCAGALPIPVLLALT